MAIGSSKSPKIKNLSGNSYQKVPIWNPLAKCMLILESVTTIASDTYYCPQSGSRTIYDCTWPALRIKWLKFIKLRTPLMVKDRDRIPRSQTAGQSPAFASVIKNTKPSGFQSNFGKTLPQSFEKIFVYFIRCYLKVVRC